ncbi:MAG: hypothetical protein K5850_07040 [Bacteroidales bacterium]|nr:hypothetical protein [Bacteroidales bacterium]
MAVFLPMFLVASFHHHNAIPELTCEGCSQNIPHSHLGQNTDLCPVCQFLSALWIASSETEQCAPLPDILCFNEVVTSGPHAVVPGCLSTRAPPVFFC